MTRMTSYLANVREALEARLQPVEGGPLDGVRILIAADMEAALAEAVIPPPDAHAAEVAEPASITLVASCHVPHCGESVPVVVRLESYTKARRESTIIGHVAIGTPTEHVCGQMALPMDAEPEAEGQTAWDIPRSPDMDTAVERIVEMLGRVGLTLDPAKVDGWTEREREQAEQWAVASHVAAESGEPIPDMPAHVTDALAAQAVEPCPNPGCTREAEHRGRHRKALPPEETSSDDDLLPES